MTFTLEKLGGLVTAMEELSRHGLGNISAVSYPHDLRAATPSGSHAWLDPGGHALPAGWELRRSTTTGRQYYFHAASRLSQWDAPRPATWSAGRPARPAPAQPPAMWQGYRNDGALAELASSNRFGAPPFRRTPSIFAPQPRTPAALATATSGHEPALRLVVDPALVPPPIEPPLELEERGGAPSEVSVCSEPGAEGGDHDPESVSATLIAAAESSGIYLSSHRRRMSRQHDQEVHLEGDEPAAGREARATRLRSELAELEAALELEQAEQAERSEDLRAELSVLKLGALQGRARDDGVSDEALSGALDEDSPRTAVITLLVAEQVRWGWPSVERGSTSHFTHRHVPPCMVHTVFTRRISQGGLCACVHCLL